MLPAALQRLPAEVGAAPSPGLSRVPGARGSPVLWGAFSWSMLLPAPWHGYSGMPPPGSPCLSLSALTPSWIPRASSTWTIQWTSRDTWRSFSGGPWTLSGSPTASRDPAPWYGPGPAAVSLGDDPGREPHGEQPCVGVSVCGPMRGGCSSGGFALRQLQRCRLHLWGPQLWQGPSRSLSTPPLHWQSCLSWGVGDVAQPSLPP